MYETTLPAATARLLPFAALLLALAAPAPVAAHDDQAPASEFKATPADGPPYPVSGLRLQIISSTPDAEAFQKLPEMELELGQVADGYVAPGGPAPNAEVVLHSAPYTYYYRSALNAICVQIVERLRKKGFDPVLVYPAEEEIDPETGLDLRAGHQRELHLMVRADPAPKRGWWPW